MWILSPSLCARSWRPHFINPGIISSFACNMYMAASPTLTAKSSDKDMPDDASNWSNESPRSINQAQLDGHLASPGLNLASLKESTRHMSGLAVRVTGWVDVHDHQEYVIQVESWASLKDAERALAPRLKAKMVAEGRVKAVSEVQRRYKSFHALHDDIRPDFPHLRLTAGKRLSLRGVGLPDGDDVKMERVLKLDLFLNEALRTALHQGVPPPQRLLQFLGIDDFEQATELPYQLTSTSVELPEAEEPELATPPSLGRHAPPTFLLGVEQEHLLAGGLSSASSSLACSLDWQEPARSPALETAEASLALTRPRSVASPWRVVLLLIVLLFPFAILSGSGLLQGKAPPSTSSISSQTAAHTAAHDTRAIGQLRWSNRAAKYTASCPPARSGDASVGQAWLRRAGRLELCEVQLE